MLSNLDKLFPAGEQPTVSKLHRQISYLVGRGLNFFNVTGHFEFCESGSQVVSGKISLPENLDTEELLLPILRMVDIMNIELDTSDINVHLSHLLHKIKLLMVPKNEGNPCQS